MAQLNVLIGILSFSFFLWYIHASCIGPVSQLEFSALQALFIAADGNNWDWDRNEDLSTIWSFPNNFTAPCSDDWQGLSCELNPQNSTSCSIYEVALMEFNLFGFLPTELGQLSQLQLLDMSENSLRGVIPSELGQLVGLEFLNLNGNALEGSIPTEFGQLQQLQNLVLDVNRLEGKIPTELGQLSQLNVLNLAINRLGGNLPTELGQLSQLQVLTLDDNSLSGDLPTELGLMSQLEVISLYTNNFDGNLPTELGYLHQLQSLSLYANNLDGTIPTELGMLSNLQALYLESNNLYGTIPTELGQAAQLYLLILYGNCLEGSLPTELGQLTELHQLSVSVNSISGSIPTEIGQLSQLEQLIVFDNRLTGTIPTELGQLLELQQLILYDNSLTGSVPQTLGQLSKLQQLSLNQNSLNEGLPTELGQLSQLQMLGLDDNDLSGSIPSQLGHLSKMQQLYLNDNDLEGCVPKEFVDLVALEQLYLQGNHLSSVGAIQSLALSVLNVSGNVLVGSLPTMPANLSYIDFSGNMLSGSISNALYNTDNVAFLDLSDNLLTGTIPTYFARFSALASVNVSMNKLSGPLDNIAVVQSRHMNTIDVSRNHLTGVIPDILFSMPLLTSLLLYDNCFSGTLPNSICGSTTLQNAYLDILTGNCGSLVPSYLQRVISASIPKKQMQGGIPSCVWSMPHLQLLHLQGNGLSGSLGKLSANSSLRVVMLSSNTLTGSLPLSWQQFGKFTQLDLSSNKLSGVLSDAYITTIESTVLDLSVNRLSGHIPTSFYNSSYVVDILNGNLFQCQAASIPQQDPSSEGYVCGSSDLNIALEIALSLLGCAMLALLVVRRTTDWLELGQNAAVHMLDTLESVTVWNAIWMFIISVVGLLLYLLLKVLPAWSMFSTHTAQYAWTSTAAYLHGWLPVLVISALLLGSSCCWIFSWSKWVNIAESAQDFNSMKNIVLIVLIHLLNLVVVLVVNGTYVDLVLSGLSAWKLFWVQIALSTFKLVWSSEGIPLLMMLYQKNKSHSHSLVMTLVSFILGPFMSVFFTSSNCFKDLFLGIAQTVSTSVVKSYGCYNNCDFVCVGTSCQIQCEDECGFFQSLIISQSISPPWIYSYQCSSSLVVDYIPVMMYSVILSDLVHLLLEIAYFFTPIKIISAVMRIVPNYFERHYMHGTVYAFTSEQALILKSRPVLQPERLRQKCLLTVAIYLTFGIASPLLSVLIVASMLIQCARNRIVLGRLLQLMASDKESRCMVLQSISDSSDTGPKVNGKYFSDMRCTFGELYSVFMAVSIFWALFIFDMLGDVYGNLAGGVSTLIPFITVVVIGCMQIRTASFLSKSNNIEMVNQC